MRKARDKAPEKVREEIEISDALRKVLEGRKEPLSKVVSMMAERYSGMIERADNTPPYCLNAHMYKEVLREAGHLLSSKEIEAFPAMCEDWCKRNPSYAPEPMKTAVMILKNSPFHDLVKLVDAVERSL